MTSPNRYTFIVLAPVALGGIVAARTALLTPLVAVPAIVLGVVAATAPALYIASAAAGQAPPLGTMIRAFGRSLSAFGVALAGLVAPAAFLALTAIAPLTAIVVTSTALAAAVGLALWRLHDELGRPALAIYGTWAVATLALAGRLWWEVVS
jgi:hypothetical protein